MTDEVPRFGRPLSGWVAPPPPKPVALQGAHVRLEPLDAARHGADLFDSFAPAPEIWDYMAVGPFADRAAFAQWLAAQQGLADPMFMALGLPDGAGGWRWRGIAAWMRITPAHGVIEVGHICLGPALQRSTAATEAIFMFMAHAFDLGYRRFEWKCDSLNAPSRRAAARFGFRHEGIFRQAMVVKGRNRDTAWYAVTDGDRPALEAAFRRWLEPANFDAQGRQRLRLSDLNAPLITGVEMST